MPSGFVTVPSGWKTSLARSASSGSWGAAPPEDSSAVRSAAATKSFSFCECRHDVIVEPGAKYSALSGIASFDQEDAGFQLQDGNHR